MGGAVDHYDQSMKKTDIVESWSLVNWILRQMITHIIAHLGKVFAFLFLQSFCISIPFYILETIIEHSLSKKFFFPPKFFKRKYTPIVTPDIWCIRVETFDQHLEICHIFVFIVVKTEVKRMKVGSVWRGGELRPL